MQTKQITALYNEFYTPLLYYATKILVEISLAEDAVADVFVNILRLNNFEFVAKNPKAYLFKATRNACMNIIRKQKSDRKKAATYEQLPDDDQLIIKTLVVNEIYKYAQQLLAPRARDIFFLKFMFGLKNKKIADIMGIKVNTVRCNSMQSLQKLRKCILTKDNILTN